MTIEKKENYTYITDDKKSFQDFFKEFLKQHSSLIKEHLLVVLSDDATVSKDAILAFIEIAHQHKENGTTFVVIHKGMDADLFPENFNIVPTLEEAEDVLEMENIERELGF